MSSRSAAAQNNTRTCHGRYERHKCPTLLEGITKTIFIRLYHFRELDLYFQGHSGIRQMKQKKKEKKKSIF